MAEYIPPALDWVREQVELYEGSGGKEGNTLLDTGMHHCDAHGREDRRHT